MNWLYSFTICGQGTSINWRCFLSQRLTGSTGSTHLHVDAKITSRLSNHFTTHNLSLVQRKSVAPLPFRFNSLEGITGQPRSLLDRMVATEWMPSLSSASCSSRKAK
ncbi:hypothetical protein T06_1448 [Trichinella sp. T6]|nr:hypothetical protein T06_1448 [Trichinella sp. T6]